MKFLIELIIFLIVGIISYYLMKVLYVLIKIITKPNEKKENLRKERKLKELEKELEIFNKKYK